MRRTSGAIWLCLLAACTGSSTAEGPDSGGEGGSQSHEAGTPVMGDAAAAPDSPDAVADATIWDAVADAPSQAWDAGPFGADGAASADDAMPVQDSPGGGQDGPVPHAPPDAAPSKTDAGANVLCSSGGCSAAQTMCHGLCVGNSDPQYGCGSDSCLPCSLPHARASCAASNCAVAACDPGWADCDGMAANGCEADLSSPTSCGTCGTTCAAPNNLCTPTGCVSVCTAPLTQCTDRCVDLATSPTHCGGCTATPCSASGLNNNGAPTCRGGVCGLSCVAGQTLCGQWGCVDTATDANNCGGCENACLAVAYAAGQCTAGRCVPTCQPGWTACGAACVTTETDSANCGACGRACAADQVCAASACVPLSSVWLATGVAGVQDITVDATSVYWADGIASVQSVPIGGGAVVTIAQGQAKPWGIAVDATHVYWSNNLGAAILRAPKDGSGHPMLVATANQPGDIALDSNSVYWIDQSTTVWKAPKTGGTPTAALTTLNNTNASMIGGPNGIFVLDHTTPRGGIIYSVLGNWSRPILDPSGFGLASDGANIYFHPGLAPTRSFSWLDGATGVLAGTFTASLESSGGFANASVTTANACGVFFTDGQKLGLLSRGSRGSGSPVTLFSGPVGAATSDGNAVYFFANNSLGKLPMP